MPVSEGFTISEERLSDLLDGWYPPEQIQAIYEGIQANELSDETIGLIRSAIEKKVLATALQDNPTERRVFAQRQQDLDETLQQVRKSLDTWWQTR